MQMGNLHDRTTTKSSFSDIIDTHSWVCLHLWEGSCKCADFVVLGPRTTKDLICVVKSTVFAVCLGAMSLLANQERV